ncbi:MAG: hypothetical protein M4579_006948 [Chaenotheca gracillima]|nr:MAG: hypothetical protein M4579_006948 [Chaenotheca gracillima]
MAQNVQGQNGQHGHRPVRIANCSGAMCDGGYQMLRHAEAGEKEGLPPVDFITGDYLAEYNIAQNAEAMKAGSHPGYEPTALEGLKLSLEALNRRRIKVVINGGALNPKGLAETIHKEIQEKGLDLSVAYVTGDDLLDRENIDMLRREDGTFTHLDDESVSMHRQNETGKLSFEVPSDKIVASNAYLGARAIRKGLEEGADIIICGRVADASPVIGAAQWWFGWTETDYDSLAGTLVAGHLIECSSYVTGANFSGFDKYPIDDLVDLGLPVAEVEANGECVITKHKHHNGIVNAEVVTCQLLYELQGSIYLNNDVKADLSEIEVFEEDRNRCVTLPRETQALKLTVRSVRVRNVKGHPPPSTTKVAMFYRGGFQSELTLNACGPAKPKFDLFREALCRRLKTFGVLDKFDILDFQVYGTSEPNPRSQLASTTAMRIFAQATDPQILGALVKAHLDNFMAHYSGMHHTMDTRTLVPKPFLAFYPALIEQAKLKEEVHLIDKGGEIRSLEAGVPPAYEAIGQRQNYDTQKPVDLGKYGPTESVPLRSIAFARSGDKGSNVNLGVFVRTDEEWAWLRTYLTRERMQLLMGDDWKDWYFVQREEMPNIKAVHFVIYGVLSRGVSSTPLLDSLGKGFAEFILSVHVDVPAKFLNDNRTWRL